LVIYGRYVTHGLSCLLLHVIDSSEGLDLSSSDKLNHHKGFCPVCRKVFDEKDIEHVRDLLNSNSTQLMVCIGCDSMYK
jgi:E3 ubiquitin-protein ligase RNF25